LAGFFTLSDGLPSIILNRALTKIERFVAGFAKISRNSRKVEVNSIGLSDRIDPAQISNSLVLFSLSR